MRYFIVFFTSTSGIVGNCDFTANDCYLSLSKTVSMIEDKFKLKGVALTNIIELSESDYKDYGCK